MRSHTNLSLLGAEKRFDALVKKEMLEHQHLISSHHKEMQELRYSIKNAMERFNSLFERCDVDLKDLALGINGQLIFLREQVKANSAKIDEQRQAIEALNKEINEIKENNVTKKQIERFKGEFDLAIKANTMSHINSFQELQRELKIWIQSLQNDLFNLRCETALMNGELDKKIENNFYVSRIDKDGVSKEIRIFEKAIFIVEKKIENIYTLIERLNKRGEACPKPE
jgi:hypothetical protein